MVDIGQGYRFHVTGLTHDDRGYPIMFEECQEYNVHPLVWKIRKFADKIIDIQETHTDDAEVVIVSFGATSRTAHKAVEVARQSGAKIGSLKLNTVWPFPEKRVTELSKRIKAFVVAEMNFGQIVLEVERCSYGNANTFFVSYADKDIDQPEALLSVVAQAARESVVKDGIIEVV